MTASLRTLAVVFAALCVWLTVRIVNRRERWAKRTLGAVIGLPVLYVASFGPACWTTSWTNRGTLALGTVYKPITLAITPNNETIVSRLVRWYAEIGAPGWQWRFIQYPRHNLDGTRSAIAKECHWLDGNSPLSL